MIQDIAPHQFNNEYSNKLPAENDYVLFYKGKKVLAHTDGDGMFGLPTFADLGESNPDIYENSTYLFAIDDESYYLVEDLDSYVGFELRKVMGTLNSKPRYLAFAAMTGFQLFNWYESRKYCGRCGSLTNKSERSRSLVCPVCGQVEYPKIAPGVIIGVTNGNKLLLAEYPQYDFYALLAGFTEIGESLEETVKREVMEEVGLRVKNIRYYKSQPWSLSDNLLAGFYCDVDGSDKITIDEEELSGADWFEREDIPKAVDYEDGSLTSEMIKYFATSGQSI